MTPWHQKASVPAVAPSPGCGGSISAESVVQDPSIGDPESVLQPQLRPIKREISRSPSPELKDERPAKPRLPRRFCFKHVMGIRGGRKAKTT